MPDQQQLPARLPAPAKKRSTHQKLAPLQRTKTDGFVSQTHVQQPQVNDDKERAFQTLKARMETALTQQKLSAIDTITEQMFTLVGCGTSTELEAQILRYMEDCEVRLELIVKKEERSRQESRFRANELIRQVASANRSGSVDYESIQCQLTEVEVAYRRARDQRHKCIPAIRTKLQAEMAMSSARQLFANGSFQQALSTGHDAVTTYLTYRQSVLFSKCELMLSIAGSDDILLQSIHNTKGDEASEQLYSHEGIEAYFKQHARQTSKELIVASKKYAVTKEYDRAVTSLQQAIKIFEWLQEAPSASFASWQTQLTRSMLSQQVERARALPFDHSELIVRISQWQSEVLAGRYLVNDLIHSGVTEWVLQVAEAASDKREEDLVLCVCGFIKGCIDMDKTCLPRLADPKLLIKSLLHIIRLLDKSHNLVVFLGYVRHLIESKASAHTVVYKCGLFVELKLLRARAMKHPEVIASIVSLYLHIATISFPVFVAPMVDAGIFDDVTSTFARFYKDLAVAVTCLKLLSLRDEEAVAGMHIMSTDSALCNAFVNAIRYFSDSKLSSENAQQVIEQVVEGIYILAKHSAEAITTFEMNHIPKLVLGLSKKGVICIPDITAKFFSVKPFRRHLETLTNSTATQNGHPARNMNASRAVSEPPQDYKLSTKAVSIRFGLSIVHNRQRNFSLVHIRSSQDEAFQVRVSLVHDVTLPRRILYIIPGDTKVTTAIVQQLQKLNGSARTAYFRSLLPTLRAMKK